jgi:CheY-like chemotaxis protein
MPGLTGYELLDALRAEETTSFIPLILLTAQSGDEERVSGLLAGAEGSGFLFTRRRPVGHWR